MDPASAEPVSPSHCIFGRRNWVAWSPESVDAKVTSLLDNFWQWRLDKSPEFATRVGLGGRDHLLEEYSEESFFEQKIKADEFLKQTEYLQNFENITHDDNINLEVLKYVLQTYIDGYQHRRFTVYNPNNFLQDWKRLIGFMKFNTEADYDNLIARYRLIPKQINEHISLMRKAIEFETTRHRLSMEKDNLYKDLLDEIEISAGESLFFNPFKKIPLEIPLRRRLKLRQRGEAAIDEWVKPAWKRLYSFLITEYVPNARQNVGLSSMPGGFECYESILRWHTTTSLSPQEVHDIGLREVQRLQDLMMRMVVEDGFQEMSLREYVDHLNSQEDNFFTSGAEMVLGYQAIVENIRKKLPSALHRVPQTAMETRGFSSDVGPQGYYIDPALDGTRPGTFFANVYMPRTKPKFDMYALTLHEAEPGHHTQAAYALEENLPQFRRTIEFRKYYAVPFNWPFMTAYIEGWALYAEYLGESMGVYEDRRALWSPRKAEAYLQKYTTLSEKAITSEVLRYITLPGQACAYKIGEIKIVELREKAELMLGENFDQRDFHHEILRLGAVPLGVLEDSISYWIQNWTPSSSVSDKSPAGAMPTAFIIGMLVTLFLLW
ncbi:hypothetical protein CAPTEDRAFT_186523 [Capitella teleta]|uniref:DUF885 domain-containing protein n=1 Tax=Capitella teleta TaxID=283909 RepID=R7V2X2_CAPTE|nr:hypothetical protein CAPTEDRAFT_186523 [Capitella teleta]|eukprot:ELU12837.1 hypothetical protein CAPTEDRAFT_186523 [Capitella teleta]